ncbi:MAG: hypothetical protein ACUVTN_03365 [Thermodesulfobacteriota bacterium]
MGLKGTASKILEHGLIVYLFVDQGKFLGILTPKKEDKGRRIIVVDKDQIIGLITGNGIAQYVQIKGR